MISRTYIESILDNLQTAKVYGIEMGVLPLRQSGKETMNLPSTYTRIKNPKYLLKTIIMVVRIYFKPRGFTAMNWEYSHLGRVRRKP